MGDREGGRVRGRGRVRGYGSVRGMGNLGYKMNIYS